MGGKEKKDKKDKKDKDEPKDEKEDKFDFGEKKPKKRIESSVAGGDGIDLWASTAADTTTKYSTGKIEQPKDKREKQKKIEEETKKDAAAGKNMLAANDIIKGMMQEKKQ